MPAKPLAGGWTPDTGKRRSMRVLLSVPVVASGNLPDGKKFEEETRTLVVNAHGALLALTIPLRNGQQLTLAHKISNEEKLCKVVYLGNAQGGKTQIGVEFMQPAPQFWGIDFPPEDWVAPEG